MIKKRTGTSMYDRMVDAAYPVIVSLCQMCKHMTKYPRDRRNLAGPFQACMARGAVPEEIHRVDVFFCDFFMGDAQRLEENEGYLSEFHIAYIKRKIE